jgi:hypothetical protein
MSVQVLTASALAALTLFMAAALVTAVPAQSQAPTTVAAAQTAQAHG